MRYDFEESRVLKFLRRHRAKRAALQLPSGFRPWLSEILKIYGEAGVEPLIMGGSCYGACDLADAEAKRLGCEVLIHYGHADMGLSTSLPTLFVEGRVNESPIKAVEKALPRLRFKRVGLLTTVQYVGHLREVSGFLRSRGVEPIVGRPGPRAKYPGQVLGCDLTCVKSIASRVDGYLYLGTGRFHPMGAALVSGKKVLLVNPITKNASVIIDAGEFLRARKAAILKAAGGEKFGIVISTKPGQTRLNLAVELQRVLRKCGRDAELVTVDELVPESIEDFDFDVLVCTACPRIPMDDAERFRQPLLTPFETRAVLGELPLEPYRLDEMEKFKRA
jgi:2-(3-amino-3-carboxypropyl)histidine synthase